MKPTTVTDETQVSSINNLAALLAVSYGEVPDTDTLARLLSNIVGKPMRNVEMFSPQGHLIHPRKLPNILCGSSKCHIRLTRENGLKASVRFPSTVGDIDKILMDLGKAQTPEEAELAEFESALRDTLDGYGHMNWTVGNEDWVACADASLGRFKGRLFLAYHVVVDCESAGFTDTFDTGFEEILPGSEPPKGILSNWLDTCWEQYLDDQTPEGGEPDPDKEHLQINNEDCLRAIAEFDAHVAKLWEGTSIDLDWDARKSPAA
jgi:hypothetical protein